MSEKLMIQGNLFSTMELDKKTPPSGKAVNEKCYCRGGEI
jgi:hypothetical protein